MLETIVKFLSWIKKYQEQLFKEAVEIYKQERTFETPKYKEVNSKLNTCKDAIRLYSVDPSTWEEQSEVFVDLKSLDKLLVESPFKPKEKLEIIAYLLKKNIATGLIDDDDINAFDSKDIYSYKFEGINGDEVRHFLFSGRYAQLKNTPLEEMNEKERQLTQAVHTYAQTRETNIGPIIKLHRKFKEHYIDKKNEMDLEDLDVVKSVLNKFGISEETVSGIYNHLRSKIEKQEARKKQQEYVQPKNIKKQEYKRYLTDKDIRSFRKEILEYYNIHDTKIIKYISYDLALYLADLLYTIGEDKETIKTFFYRVKTQPENVSFISVGNPLSEYVAVYDKLKFYEQKYDLKEQLDTIEEYLKEMFICSDEDYDFWKSQIGFELRSVLYKIDGTFDYELANLRTMHK